MTPKTHRKKTGKNTCAFAIVSKDVEVMINWGLHECIKNAEKN